MAEDEAAARDESSWWALDADDSPLPASSFEEPVAWPEAMAWTDGSGPNEPAALVPPLDVDLDMGPGPFAGPAEKEPDLAFDLGPVTSARGASDVDLDPLPPSIWDVEPQPDDARLVVTSGGSRLPAPAPIPPFYADPDRPPSGRRRGRFTLPHVNPAAAAVAAFVALVLVGLVFSLRNRGDGGSATAAQAARPSGNIAAQGRPATPLGTTTTQLPSGISLADLLAPGAIPGADGSGPPADGAGTVTSPPGGGTAGGSGAPAPATGPGPTSATATPGRAPASSGGGGSSTAGGGGTARGGSSTGGGESSTGGGGGGGQQAPAADNTPRPSPAATTPPPSPPPDRAPDPTPSPPVNNTRPPTSSPPPSIPTYTVPVPSSTPPTSRPSVPTTPPFSFPEDFRRPPAP